MLVSVKKRHVRFYSVLSCQLNQKVWLFPGVGENVAGCVYKIVYYSSNINFFWSASITGEGCRKFQSLENTKKGIS